MKFEKNIYKIFFLVLVLMPSLSSSKGVDNDSEFDKYLTGYAEECAKYSICGEYDSCDVANIGIYFDEIVSSKYLKKQILKYGSQEKASDAAIERVQKMEKEIQHKIIENGVPEGMCQKLLNGSEEGNDSEEEQENSLESELEKELESNGWTKAIYGDDIFYYSRTDDNLTIILEKLSEPRIFDGKEAVMLGQTVNFYCKNKKIQRVSTQFFSSDGELVNGKEEPDFSVPFENIAEGSKEELLSSFVCN